MKKSILLICLLFLVSFSFAQHTLGEWYGGGTVFYLYDNGLHGLIAAHEDQSTSAKWSIGTGPGSTLAYRNGIGASGNTISMISATGISSPAALSCVKYNGGDFGDWYLPSKYELNIMYQNKNFIDNLSMWYWSSTESGSNEAWVQNLKTGGQFSTPKANAYHVRAIRIF